MWTKNVLRIHNFNAYLKIRDALNDNLSILLFGRCIHELKVVPRALLTSDLSSLSSQYLLIV